MFQSPLPFSAAALMPAAVIQLFGIVGSVTAAVTEPTAPVTLATLPVKFPVKVVVKPVVIVVAAFVPAMNRPPAAPAVADGRKSVFVLTESTRALIVVVGAVPDVGVDGALNNHAHTAARRNDEGDARVGRVEGGHDGRGAAFCDRSSRIVKNCA
jgi:hypothetical protein